MPARTRQISDKRNKIFNADFITASDIYRNTFIEILSGLDDPFSGVFNMKEFTSRRTVSPNDYLFLTSSFSFNAFLDKRWNDMRTLGIEIISRSIEVDGHKENRIESVLLTIGLALDEHHFFRQGVGSDGPTVIRFVLRSIIIFNPAEVFTGKDLSPLAG